MIYTNIVYFMWMYEVSKKFVHRVSCYFQLPTVFMWKKIREKPSSQHQRPFFTRTILINRTSILLPGTNSIAYNATLTCFPQLDLMQFQTPSCHIILAFTIRRLKYLLQTSSAYFLRNFTTGQLILQRYPLPISSLMTKIQLKPNIYFRTPVCSHTRHHRILW